MSNVRINRNIAYVDNLSKQKVKPALALFSKEVTTALRDEYGSEADRTTNFLEIFQDCIIQPLLTVSPSKANKVKEVSVFEQADDIRIKCFNEISSWLIN